MADELDHIQAAIEAEKRAELAELDAARARRNMYLTIAGSSAVVFLCLLATSGYILLSDMSDDELRATATALSERLVEQPRNTPFEAGFAPTNTPIIIPSQIPTEYVIPTATLAPTLTPPATIDAQFQPATWTAIPSPSPTASLTPIPTEIAAQNAEFIACNSSSPIPLTVDEYNYPDAIGANTASENINRVYTEDTWSNSVVKDTIARFYYPDLTEDQYDPFLSNDISNRRIYFGSEIQRITSYRDNSQATTPFVVVCLPGETDRYLRVAGVGYDNTFMYDRAGRQIEIYDALAIEEEVQYQVLARTFLPVFNNGGFSNSGITTPEQFMEEYSHGHLRYEVELFEHAMLEFTYDDNDWDWVGLDLSGYTLTIDGVPYTDAAAAAKAYTQAINSLTRSSYSTEDLLKLMATPNGYRFINDQLTPYGISSRQLVGGTQRGSSRTVVPIPLASILGN